jgi:hypothetical protein
MINTILSGFYGAVGSLMGKLAFSFESPYVTVLVNKLCSILLRSDACNTWLSTLFTCIRVFLFILMVFFNALMISSFFKALERNVRF